MDQMLTIFIFLILVGINFFVCLNFGCIVSEKIFKNKYIKINKENFSHLIFFGFSFICILTSVFHIFFKVNYLLFYIISLIAISYFFFTKKNKIKLNLNKQSYFFLLIIVTLSIISLNINFVSDTGLYHFPVLKIFNEHNSIFGISNIFIQYGYNNLSHYYYSLINSTFLIENLSSPSVMIFSTTLYYLYTKSQIRDQKWVIILIFISYIFYNAQYISSLAPDLITNSIIVIIFIEIILFSKSLKKNENANIKLNTIFFYILILFQIKFTTILICILLTMYLFFFYKNEIYFNKNIIYFSLFSIFVFFTKNIIFSGFPFFPLNIFDLNLSWSYPFERYNDITFWITNFAKNTHNISYDIKVLKWVIPWIFENNQNKLFTLSVIIPLVLTFANFKIFFENKKNSKDLYFFLIIIFCLMFWFFMAPDIRFSLMLNVFFIIMTIKMNKILKGKVIKFTEIFIKIIALPVIVFSFYKLNYINFYEKFKNVNLKNKVIFEKKIDKYQFIITQNYCWNSKPFCSYGLGYRKVLANLKLEKSFFNNLVIISK